MISQDLSIATTRSVLNGAPRMGVRASRGQSTDPHSIAERVRKCSHVKHCYRILLMCMYIASFAVVYLTTNSFGSHENSHCRGLSLSSFNLLLLKRCEPFLLIIVFLLEGTQGEDCEKFEIFAGASSKC